MRGGRTAIGANEVGGGPGSKPVEIGCIGFRIQVLADGW